MQNNNISIQAKDLTIGYNLPSGKKKVVHPDINISLYSGEVTCLLGLNGAGKSTMLRTLCGFQPPLRGQVFLQGELLNNISQSQFARLVGVVLTEKNNAGGITVYELVSLGRHPYTGFFGQLKPNDHKIIEQALQSVGISHKAKNYVSELSDGERQKAMIAKALAQECPIIILDEPTAFLDVTSRIETMVLLRKLAHQKGKTILLSTHDMDSAIQMGDCVWLLSKGKPMRFGAPEDLIMDGAFGEFFNKENIVFDSTTGKLNTASTGNNPIGVEGDFQTAFWVGNALIRNGYTPTTFAKDHINISCISKSNIEITFCNGTKKQATNIACLCKILQE